MRSVERTAATKDLDWAKLIETALNMPGDVGSVYSRFHSYSYLNTVYLMMQGVTEPVAGYQRWKTLGRQVLRGSKAKEIVRPIVIEKKNEAGDVEDKYLRFKPVRCLFTYSETEGEELPPVEPRQWHLATALDELQVKQIPYALIDGNTQGYSIGREFAINPVAVNPLKTTFHELGHIVLGHTMPEAAAEYATHRGIKEFQAEATAYLTMNELEQLDEEQASQSRGYIQHWLRNDRPPDVAIKQVFAATDKILKAGRLAVEGGESE